MVVYLDVLIFTNIFINYFILKITSALMSDDIKTYRIILGSIAGALFSLYIFLPPSGIVAESSFKLICSAVTVLIAFGFTSPKSFLRRILVFFASSFLFAGFMLGIWAILKPQNLAINNGIVYINISPAVLIVATLFAYLIISLIRLLGRKQAYNGKRCKVNIFLKDKKADATVLVDTGHSLTDSLTGRSVIIVEESIAKRLFGILPTPELAALGEEFKGFRLIPYKSVGGVGLLTAFVADKIAIALENSQKEITSPLIAISKERLGEDYKGILSPDILEN